MQLKHSATFVIKSTLDPPGMGTNDFTCAAPAARLRTANVMSYIPVPSAMHSSALRADRMKPCALAEEAEALAPPMRIDLEQQKHVLVVANFNGHTQRTAAGHAANATLWSVAIRHCAPCIRR